VGRHRRSSPQIFYVQRRGGRLGLLSDRLRNQHRASFVCRARETRATRSAKSLSWPAMRFLVHFTPPDWIGSAPRDDPVPLPRIPPHSFIDSASPLYFPAAPLPCSMFLVSCFVSGWEKPALRRLQTAALVPCTRPTPGPLRRPGAVRDGGRGCGTGGDGTILNLPSSLPPAWRPCRTYGAVSHPLPLVLDLQPFGATAVDDVPSHIPKSRKKKKMRRRSKGTGRTGRTGVGPITGNPLRFVMSLW
jgi:hypothetical protein